MGLGSPQQLVVLAALLLRRPHPVPAKDLIDAVWGSAPPRSAVNQLHIYVHRLRRATEHGGRDEPLIESVGSQYRLAATGPVLDLEDFHRLTAEAARIQRAQPGRAGELLSEALALWQGDPLGDLPGEWARGQRERLRRIRLDALERSFRIRLGTAPDYGLTQDLVDAVAENPFDERFREILMLRLYRSGRQSEALEVYGQTRTLLAAELGIDPGPGLRALHERILRADEGLLDTEAGAAGQGARPAAAVSRQIPESGPGRPPRRRSTTACWPSAGCCSCWTSCGTRTGARPAAVGPGQPGDRHHPGADGGATRL
ncbi:BTAD domain-containing putative transcriptional regulator [Streptomyces mirabilis]|uniref:AfsR/SARP family transcriptional regulator n=1 Tax=Streptomyces mirabilis TaxID=68239 RepID=UPI0036CA8527